MKNILLASFTLISLSATAQIKASKSIILQKGQKINVRISNVSDTEMGMGMQVKNNSENTSVLTVMEETEKEYVLTNTLTKLKLSIEGMGQTQEFDSEKESDKSSEIGKSLGETIGKSISVTVNKMSGTPVYNTGSAGPEKAEPNPMESMMTAFGGDEPSVGGAFLIMPAGKMVGESWTEADSTKDKKGTKTYTIRSIAGNIAQLTFISDLFTTTSLDANGSSMAMQMNIKSTGDVTVDATTGLVSKRTTVSDITGTLEIQGQTLPITAKSDLTAAYTVLKN